MLHILRMFYLLFLIEGSGIPPALTLEVSRVVTLLGVVALLQNVHMSLIHREREGKLRTAYVEGFWSVKALNVWIALSVRICEDQNAGNKTLCTQKLLRPAKCKFYCGFPVARPILNSYTKPPLHCMFIRQPTLTAIMYRHPSSQAL